MRDEPRSGDHPGVLTPSVPPDVGSRSQQQRILVAMSRSCAEKSFSATTIGDIVERASISRATFYKHFANKRECFDRAVEGFAEELVQVAVGTYSNATSQPEAVRKAVAAVLERLAKEPAYARLTVIEAPILEPGIIATHRDQAMDALKLHWEPGQTSDGTMADPRLAFGRAHVLAADYIAAGKIKKLPELVPEIVYILLLPFVGHREALAQVKLVR